MFTGLVQAVGTVVRLDEVGHGRRLVIDPGGWSYAPKEGDSISVSGCCLTHAPAAGEEGTGMLAFDVVAETLRKTSLGSLGPGARVNLEPCLTPSDPIGGHFVQGHVDGLARVVEIHRAGGEHRVTLEVDETLMQWIVPTGSVALDGVSLTVASVEGERERFAVALIPTTLRRTTLGELAEGGVVNVEGDVLVKAAVSWLVRYGPGGLTRRGG